MHRFKGIFLLVLLLPGCDLDGKKNCAWVLEAEPGMIDKVDPGMIPVCARNRETQKEDCRLQWSLDNAKAAYGRKFRYVDLEIVSPGLPRTIKSLKYCDGR